MDSKYANHWNPAMCKLKQFHHIGTFMRIRIQPLERRIRPQVAVELAGFETPSDQAA
jgi:hypothetical protein